MESLEKTSVRLTQEGIKIANDALIQVAEANERAKKSNEALDTALKLLAKYQELAESYKQDVMKLLDVVEGQKKIIETLSQNQFTVGKC